jgi:hypothetical protein
MAATKTQAKARSTKPAARKTREPRVTIDTKIPAPVVAPTIEGKGQGIGAFCKEQLMTGKTNQEVFGLVKQQFPNASTSIGCVAWYRAAMKKAGQI